MKKLYFLALILSSLLINARAFTNSCFVTVKGLGVLDTARKHPAKPSSKIIDTRLNKPAYLKTEVNINFTPFKPVNIRQSSTTNTPPAQPAANSTAKPSQPDLKVVSNVKVYPNPVEDQINLSYNVNKDSNVTIKIMDVLGNEIATLLSQRMPAGEQTNSFSISSRLNSGYYFIRLMVGNETVIKRISIL